MTLQSLFKEPHSYRILVVDDNPTNLRVMVDSLSQSGFRALTARNGMTAIERAKLSQPDIILLDVLMPGLNGFETCRQLKSDERTKDIPVIFMTALSETKQKIAGFNAGAVDYVTKPIQQAEVLARITTHLHIRELTHNLEQLVTKRTSQLEESVQREQHLARQLKLSLAKEVELSALRADIIEVVTHEFRTPLTVITQSATLLENFFEQLDTSKRQEILNKITQSSFFIESLIRDISLINRIEMEDIETTPETVPYTAFCEQIGEMLQQLPEAEERLRFAYQPCEVTLTIDINIVKQILVNIVTNGVKFSTPPDVVDVMIEVVEQTAVVTVKDKGIGVPQEEEDHIFGLFNRGSNASSIRGLGLGLHISQQLATIIGATLSLHQNSDKGSIFCLVLPLSQKGPY